MFKNLTPKIFHTDFVSAELVKLFNTYRYINFSISNQFAIIAEDYGVRIFDIIKWQIRTTRDQTFQCS